jgi:hypothetical protein
VKEIIDEAFGTYEMVGEMDATQVAQSREKIGHYIGTLISAGQNDPRRLAEYARAYLKEMHEGRDPRFSGC